MVGSSAIGGGKSVVYDSHQDPEPIERVLARHLVWWRRSNRARHCYDTTPTEIDAGVAHLEEVDPKPAARSDLVPKGSESNRLKLERVYPAAATVSEVWGDHDTSNVAEHPGNDIEFEDCARELAFLHDLTEAASTTLDTTGPHVRHPSLSVKQQDRVVKVLKSHERIMISSGNAYGVVCDINGLLKADLIAFLDSPWALPIVIVLKKSGVDIHICIDTKMVHSVTVIMEYAMPLVDDILKGMAKVRSTSIQKAEASDAAVSGLTTDTATLGRTQFEADRENSGIPDSLSAVVNDPRGDMLASGEADQSSLVPVFERSVVDDICFGGEAFDRCLETLDLLLRYFEECRISVSFTKRMFVQPMVDFLSHAVLHEGLRADA
ncbi:unnamed protein product [Phytophthora fragariaefolia]|uniref:Unnamed protein product n=1 Tax=Phytophthora fragariaefolia TaxID=1490495 RepID=A0A9W7CR92_9STRA|nr:unnamed protein product [Phytophthora fragariaefolia]